jgi:hypothetical protein
MDNPRIVRSRRARAAAWVLSLAAGMMLYTIRLLFTMGGIPIAVEGQAGERLGVFAWIHIPVAFALAAAVTPRCWGVPAGTLIGTAIFLGAVACGGLWETGPNYPGPGPGLAVAILAWFCVLGSGAGALLRTL